MPDLEELHPAGASFAYCPLGTELRRSVLGSALIPTQGLGRPFIPVAASATAASRPLPQRMQTDEPLQLPDSPGETETIRGPAPRPVPGPSTACADPLRSSRAPQSSSPISLTPPPQGPHTPALSPALPPTGPLQPWHGSLSPRPVALVQMPPAHMQPPPPPGVPGPPRTGGGGARARQDTSHAPAFLGEVPGHRPAVPGLD